MRKLALYAPESGARRLLRTASRLHLDSDGLSFFSMEFSLSASRSQTLVLLAPLLLETFSGRSNLALARVRCCPPGATFIERRQKRLLLGGDIGDRSVERCGALARLFKFSATGAELRFGLGE